MLQRNVFLKHRTLVPLWVGIYIDEYHGVSLSVDTDSNIQRIMHFLPSSVSQLQNIPFLLWGCHGHWRVFSSILGLHLLDASSKLLSSFNNQKSLQALSHVPWVNGWLGRRERKMLSAENKNQVKVQKSEEVFSQVDLQNNLFSNIL